MRTYAVTLSEQQRSRLIDTLEVEHNRLETCLSKLKTDDVDDCAIIRDYITQTIELVGQVAAAPRVPRRIIVGRSRQLQPFNGRSFYGKRPGDNLIRGLRPIVKHGSMKGQPYSWIDFVDARGVKWRIAPLRFRENGLPEELKVLVRTKRTDHSDLSGRRLPSAPGTPAGLYELILYIRKCENEKR